MSGIEHVDEKYQKSLNCDNCEKLLHGKNDKNITTWLTKIAKYISKVENGLNENDEIDQNYETLLSLRK